MELADYLRILRRRWWLVVLAVILSLAGAAAATFTQEPRYRTSTRLLVSGSSSTSAIDEIARRELANQRAVAYAQIASTGPAVRAAADAAGVAIVPGVSATADGQSPFVVITVTADNARTAQAVANAYVEVLPRVVTRLDQVPSATPITLSALELAHLPARPFSPSPRRNLFIGGVLGLLLGAAAALVRETLDVRLRESSEIERATNVTLLGVVPKELTDERLPAMSFPRSRRSEAYRQVRTNLEFTGPAGTPRSIVVTSAGQGEGKSSLATNLGVIASRAGKNVVVVDADLRKPMVSKYFDIELRKGLSDVLSGRASLDDVLHPVPGERITLLGSGRVPNIPSELLGSTAMVELLEELEERFDLVILDTPPVLPVADALLIAVNVGGVVLVTRLGQSTRAGLRRAVDAVHKVNGRLLGIVANGAAEGEDKAYGYGYASTSTSTSTDDAEGSEVRPTEHIRAARRRASAIAETPPESATTERRTMSLPVESDRRARPKHRRRAPSSDFVSNGQANNGHAANGLQQSAQATNGQATSGHVVQGAHHIDVSGLDPFQFPRP